MNYMIYYIYIWKRKNYKIMEIIQSFIYSVSRVKLGLYEQRILLKVIEHAQIVLKGKLVKNMLFRMEHNLDNVRIDLPVRYIMSDGSKHYELIKEAARTLMGRRFEFYDTATKGWYSSPLIYNVAYVQGSGLLSFYVSKMLFDVALDFTKGFCKYDLETALNLANPHAVRLYALLSGQTKPLIYPIEELKKMFGVDDKYKQTRDFILKIIEPAKKCLDEAKCNTFEFNRIRKGNKVIQLQFIPKRVRQETAEELAAKISMRRLVDQEILIVMISYMGFTTKELSAHKVLLNEYCKLPFAQDNIYQIERRFRKKKKSKGYVIAAIRSEVDAWKAIQNNSNETKTD